MHLSKHFNAFPSSVQSVQSIRRLSTPVNAISTPSLGHSSSKTPEPMHSKENAKTPSNRKFISRSLDRPPHLSARRLGSEVRLELRGIPDFSPLAIASVSGPLATGAGGASRGGVVFVRGAAAGAGARGASV